MALKKYEYDITDDFTNSAVAPDKLKAEIEASSIATALSHINTDGDNCEVWFVDTLSAGEKTTLDGDTSNPAGGLIGAHDGVSPTDVSGSYASSDGESTTTNTAWTEKLSYAPGWLVAGDYMVEWYCELYSAEHDVKVHMRVECDDATTLGECSPTSTTNNSDQWIAQSGFGKLTLAAGTHTFDIDYKSASGDSVKIRRARVHVRAV